MLPRRHHPQIRTWLRSYAQRESERLNERKRIKAVNRPARTAAVQPVLYPANNAWVAVAAAVADDQQKRQHTVGRDHNERKTSERLEKMILQSAKHRPTSSSSRMMSRR